MLSATHSRTRHPDLSALQIVLAAVVAVAGLIHVGLAPEHLAGSALLGLGFIVSGTAQLLTSVAVLGGRDDRASLAALAVSAGSLAPLVAAVTIGLPLLPAGATMGPMGPVEPLDDLGALTGFVEVIAIVVSIRLLRPRAGTGGRR